MKLFDVSATRYMIHVDSNRNVNVSNDDKCVRLGTEHPAIDMYQGYELIRVLTRKQG